jgi:1-acyl-sn-glycerol-3-phosphate acyltransferase
MWIPLFGWYVARMNMVPVKRGDRARALRDVVAKSTERLGQGRELLIYPEGTRRPPGAEPAYKYGIVELYARLGVPVVPIAHQAGLFWPRRKMVRHPGTIDIRILPPIPPGLAKEEFQSRLVSELEAASDAILVETAARPGCPPLPSTARARLAALKAAAN